MTGSDGSLYDDFPIDDYYRPSICGARTLMRTGKWWRAAVLIRDPKTQIVFLQLYLWEKKDGKWKRRSSYKISKRAQAKELLDYLDDVWRSIEEKNL